MVLKTKAPRDQILYVRVTTATKALLERFKERHNLSEADIIEALIHQEEQEQRRLKGKTSRYRRKSKG